MFDKDDMDELLTNLSIWVCYVCFMVTVFLVYINIKGYKGG